MRCLIVCAFAHDDVCLLNATNKPQGGSRYRLEIVTGSAKLAGTDANISIELVGEKGRAEPNQLEKSLTNKDKWERGKTDVFEISVNEDIGRIASVVVVSDNKSGAHLLHPEWQLDSITLSTLSPAGDAIPDQSYSFACSQVRPLMPLLRD